LYRRNQEVKPESSQPRKQRKWLYNAPLHKKRKWIAAHLAENLLLKYNRRTVTLVKGDTVKVMRGAFKGHEDKITRVDVKKGLVEIEGVTLTKADGEKVPRPIHPSNLLITKLNLTDRWRRKRLEESLPEEAKKEIEAEAVQQEKELEEEKRREEERKRKEEETVAEEPTEVEEAEETKEETVEGTLKEEETLEEPKKVEEDKTKKPESSSQEKTSEEKEST